MAPEEVQVLQVGASPVMLISLQKGGLDGAMLQDPSFFMAEDGGFKTLGDPAAMDIHYLQNVIAATRGYLRANRDLAGRFIKGFVEGIAYYKKNKDESIKILMKKMRIERGNEGYLVRSYQLYASQYFDNVPYPSMPGVKTVLEFLAKDNAKAKGSGPECVRRSEFRQNAGRQRIHQSALLIGNGSSSKLRSFKMFKRSSRSMVPDVRT